MPFETIQYPRTNQSSGTEVSVHWSKTGHVQLHVQRHEWDPHPNVGDGVHTPKADPNPVGTVRVGPNAIAYRAESESWVIVPKLGSVVESAYDGDVEEWPVAVWGDGRSVAADIYTEVLDRSEINRLIRTLRRARDQAYGADA